MVVMFGGDAIGVGPVPPKDAGRWARVHAPAPVAPAQEQKTLPLLRNFHHHQFYQLLATHFTPRTMKPVTRFTGTAIRRAARTSLRVQSPVNCIIAGRAPAIGNATLVRSFHVSMGMRVGIMPDSEDPKPKESEAHDEPGKPTELSIEEFHERADHYLGELLQRLEEAQENDPTIEVDYSVRLY